MDLLPLIILLSSCYCSFFYYKKYKTIKNELDKKYIKVDVRVKDAFYEAYEWAKKNHNDFEAKTFLNLLTEAKEKS